MSGRQRSPARHRPVAMLVALAALCGVTHAALADHRPFGVLPEGNIRLDSPAAYDAVVTLSDGRLLVEGEFARVDGERVSGPVLLDANGRLLRALAPRCVGQSVVPGRKPCRLSLLALPDGGFVVAGGFEAIDGEVIAGIARYRADGTLDTDFRPIASVTPEQAVQLVGVALGHLYFRSSGTFRRVPLAPPHIVDPTYTIEHVDPVHVLAPDGRLFLVGRFAGMYMGILRRNPDGSFAGTISGVPEPTALWFDPGTARLFALSRAAGGAGTDLFRIDPGTGVESDWRLERVPSDRQVTLTISPRALDAGRIIGEQSVGTSRWLTVNAASNGNLIAAVPLPVARDAAYFGDGAGGWIAVPPRLERIGMIAEPRPANPLVRLNAALSIDPSLATDIHAIGAAFTSAPATGGGFFIGGEFGAVEGIRRQRLARLDAAWRIDPGWQVADAARPRFPIWNVGHTSNGILVAGEYNRLIQTVGVPVPELILAAGSGEPAHRRSVRSSPFSGIVVGEHVYGWQLCPWPPEQQQPPAIWRVPAAPLMRAPPPFFGQCAFDVTWQLNEFGHLFAVSPDGWVYFYVQDNTGGGTIRRIRPLSGAVPDPAMVINLPPPVVSPNFMQIWRLTATTAHVYVSRLTQPSGAGELLRFRTSDGQPDPTWPAVTRLDVTGALAADAEWVYYWDRLPEGPPWRGPWALYRRSASDGTATGPLRALESSLPTDSGHPDPTLTVIGDGRAIATWRFVELDGIPRDGFAIVGSVEAIMVDGFEATP